MCVFLPVCLYACLSAAVQWCECGRSAAWTTASRKLKFSHHVDDVSGECSVAKLTHYSAQRARGTSRKSIFSIALACEILRAKCAKNAKSAEHGCNLGRPYVWSLWDKHKCDENRMRWRMECLFEIITRHCSINNTSENNMSVFWHTSWFILILRDYGTWIHEINNFLRKCFVLMINKTGSIMAYSWWYKPVSKI